MPVGTVASPDANRIAQLARIDRAIDELTGDGSGNGRGAPRGSAIAGGETVTGVSLGDPSNRGDLDSTAEPQVITVTNSEDLNAIAQAVAAASFGEGVVVENSSFTQRPGGINIDLGTIFERLLTIRQTTLVADVIKARSYQLGGQDALLVEGSTFDATRLVRLYAGGVSNLRFRGEVNLNTPLAQLAGSNVIIDPGGTVRATGDVQVFADSHQYDTPGSGTLQAAGTKTRATFVERPRY